MKIKLCLLLMEVYDYIELDLKFIFYLIEFLHDNNYD